MLYSRTVLGNNEDLLCASIPSVNLLNLSHLRPSLVAQMVKNPPEMQETWVLFLSLEDPLEKGTATHSNILAWRIPRTEEPDRPQFMGVAKRQTLLGDFHFSHPNP